MGSGLAMLTKTLQHWAQGRSLKEGDCKNATKYTRVSCSPSGPLHNSDGLPRDGKSFIPSFESILASQFSFRS